MHAVEPCLALANGYEAIAQLGRVLAQRTHLGAREHDAGLDAVFHEVVVQRLAVLGDICAFLFHVPSARRLYPYVV